MILRQAKVGEGLAGGEPELELDKVDAGDLLGDGVLDLEAGVRLDEPELAVVVVFSGDEELERAEVAVAARPGEAHGSSGDALAKGGSKSGGGGDLDDLLVAALDAAVALAEVGHAAAGIARDLHLDVAGAGNPALDVEARVAETLFGLGGAALEGGVDLGGLGDGAHATAAPTGDGLDEHARSLGKVGEEGARFLDRHGVREAGHDGDVVGLGEGASLRLRPEEVERPGAGADERKAGLLAGARESGAFGEEAVAGVDGVAARPAGGGHELVDVEVGGDAAAVEGADGIGLARVEAAGVVLGMHGNGTDSELAGRAHDADGDLPAVGDEQTLDGHGSFLRDVLATAFDPTRQRVGGSARAYHRRPAARHRCRAPRGARAMTEATGTPTSDELARMALELRNWGRWGEEDERGALNLITDAKRAQAAALVREGLSVSCARPLPVMPSMENPTPVQHHMISGGDASTADDRFGIARDYFAIAPHGMATTHLDALCHIFYEGKMYNGYDKGEVRTDGAKRNSIMAGADGIVSRGVLLDIPPVRDAQWLEPMANITIAELEAAEARQGVRVEAGDILLVATGRDPRKESKGPGAPFDGLAGLDASCLPWVRERDVAVIGCDGVTDAMPSGVDGWPMPFHQVAIANMGVHLIDNMNLERLLAACRERDRWEFLFALAPLRLEGGTASPLNPLAIF